MKVKLLKKLHKRYSWRWEPDRGWVVSDHVKKSINVNNSTRTTAMLMYCYMISSIQLSSLYKKYQIREERLQYYREQKKRK